MKEILQKIAFAVRYRYLLRIQAFFCNNKYRLLGMKIGKGTYVRGISVTWPHQVSIGDNCNVEHAVYFKFDGIWAPGYSIIIGDGSFIGNNVEFNCVEKIEIGKFGNIASGCRFIDHDHGVVSGLRIGAQEIIKAPIILEEDVWLGCNVVVLKGVRIGTGAVVAAGAVVTKSIPANEIWGGVPAKRLKARQDTGR